MLYSTPLNGAEYKKCLNQDFQDFQDFQDEILSNKNIP
jgi:hypothetical protein